MSVEMIGLESDSKRFGEENEVIDDPEIQAELEYAEQNGLDMSTIRMRLKKAKTLVAAGGAGGDAVQNGVVTVPRAVKNQRKSRAGRGRGQPKKGGSGGKGVWGAAGKLYEEPEFCDQNDPNYDSDVQAEVKFEDLTPELAEEELAKHIEAILIEYFDNGGVADAMDGLDELELSRRHRPFLIRLLVTVAIDHKATHRELTSQLISELVHTRRLTTSDVEKGFDRLLNSDLFDLVIDCPTAAEILGTFIARAGADEAVTAKFIDADKERLNNPQAVAALEKAKLLVLKKHRLDDVWGVGSGEKPVRFLTKKIKLLLEEFLSSEDDKEAVRCLRELEVPHFHHEVVFQAGVIVVEAMHSRPTRVLSEFLSKLFASGVISPAAIRTGFERLFAALPDLSLDVPPAFTLTESFVDGCRRLGFLTDEVARKMPQKGRKRFVSEGDGGRLKVVDVPHPLL